MPIIHEGKNIKRFREILRMKQETLAVGLGSDWNQKKISLLENKETIDEKLLQQVAGILQVPIEAIKNFSEEQVTHFTQNNYKGATNNYQTNVDQSLIDKLIQSYEDKIKLYERIIKEKDELIQKLLQEKSQ
jgi:transcriptional regulator with XRE-family HTH domain